MQTFPFSTKCCAVHGRALPLRGLALILAPPLLVPLLWLEADTPAIGRTAWVMALMAVYWCCEALPIAVTSLLPLVLFPLLGVLPADRVSRNYFKDKNFLFFGGLVVAAALEAVRMHERVALRVLLVFGTTPHRLLLGFMLATAFLSMWMNNTATTAMMMPIAEAVLGELETRAAVGSLGKALVLGVAWAANIGGMATLTGTGPNIVLAGQFSALYPAAPPLSFASWIAFAAPLALFVLLAAWMLLLLVHLPRRQQYDPAETDSVIRRQYEQLGAPSFRELLVLAAFVLLALLWITRHPGFVPGWDTLFTSGFVTDGTSAIAITLLLFALPASPPEWLGSSCRHCLGRHKKGAQRRASSHYALGRAKVVGGLGGNEMGTSGTSLEGLANNLPRSDQPSSSQPVGLVEPRAGSPPSRLVSWADIEARVPWGVLLLLGGGFALADACVSSGLSQLIGANLTWLGPLPAAISALFLMLIVSAVTAVTSNVATASIFVPVVSSLAQSMQLHPLYLLIPVTLTTSLAFVLPVSTPPNALAFASGRITACSPHICPPLSTCCSVARFCWLSQN